MLGVDREQVFSMNLAILTSGLKKRVCFRVDRQESSYVFQCVETLGVRCQCLARFSSMVSRLQDYRSVAGVYVSSSASGMSGSPGAHSLDVPSSGVHLALSFRCFSVLSLGVRCELVS